VGLAAETALIREIAHSLVVRPEKHRRETGRVADKKLGTMAKNGVFVGFSA
jgi:hypothetical protein